MKQFGCLIVGFRRKSELVQVMSKVRDEYFDKVFVSVDSATGLPAKVLNENRAARQSVVEFVGQNRLDWELIFPDSRLGIIGNFTRSIDKAFESVDYLCVLEDDCIPSTGLLKYLRHVANVQFPSKVRMFTFFRPDLPGISEGYFLTHNPLMWGWAISKEDWLEIKRGVIEDSKIHGLAKNFNILFQSFYFSGYCRALSGQSDALDALIAYFLFKKDFLVVGPPVNLISNIGFGDSATNTKTKSTHMNSLTSDWIGTGIAKPIIIENRFSILSNDYAIARHMNGWKLHHVISNVIKIKLSSLLRR